jgi:hypothetical protein
MATAFESSRFATQRPSRPLIARDTEPSPDALGAREPIHSHLAQPAGLERKRPPRSLDGMFRPGFASAPNARSVE